MNCLVRGLLIALATLLLFILIAPLVVPVPPLEGTVPPEQLADPDSRFLEIDDLSVHYKMAGSGTPALVLMHGFGASVFSWREVMGPLGTRGTVVAFDRPAFGLTSRPMPGEWSGPNPYSTDYQVHLTVAIMDAIGVEQAVLVGHSAGGSIATLVALRHPNRVQALVLVSANIYSEGGPPDLIKPLLNTPQMQRIGPLFVRYLLENQGENAMRLAWHDPTKITPEVMAGYRKPLQAEDWDRALWELTRASQPQGLPVQLPEVKVPVLVVTGDDDRIVPTEQSIRLAEELPDAKLVVIRECGHLPHEERPAEFLAAVEQYLDEMR